MKRLLIMTVALLTAFMANAQKVTFFSEAFEEGVKAHVGLGDTDDVLQLHTDTITHINLSGLGIKDISDVVYLQSIERLDLSNNYVVDISSLLSLKNLRVLNLRNNRLENVDALVFSSSKQIDIDVSLNFIGNFDLLFEPTSCRFTVHGMDMQKEKDVPYLDVRQLYGSVDNKDELVVSYRGYSNLATAAVLKCGSFQTSANMDGETYVKAVKHEGTDAAKVILSCGDKEVYTYVVPTKDYRVGAEKTVEMSTGLPEDYQLTYAKALYGTTTILDNKILYTAPLDTPADTVYYSYYQGGDLKGFSRFYANKSNIRLGDANGDGKVDVADVVEVLNYIRKKQSDKFVKESADVNQDGDINEADVEEITKIILGKK